MEKNCSFPSSSSQSFLRIFRFKLSSYRGRLKITFIYVLLAVSYDGDGDDDSDLAVDEGHGGVGIRGDVGIDSCCDWAWARLMY